MSQPAPPSVKGTKSAPPKSEQPLLNLLLTIVLPVIILNKSNAFGEQGPVIALVLALLLPLGWGLKGYFFDHTKNFLAIFGVVNVLFTGGLALWQAEGMWFAVKEGAFPFVLGVGVLLSGVWGKRPFLQSLILQAHVLDIEKMQCRLNKQHGACDTLLGHGPIRRLFKKTNAWFALSFFISSFLNVVLALRIFQPIDPNSSATAQAILNEQLARMTWMGYVVIALPLSIFTGFVMWYLMKSLCKHTGLEFQELLKR